MKDLHQAIKDEDEEKVKNQLDELYDHLQKRIDVLKQKLDEQ